MTDTGLSVAQIEAMLARAPHAPALCIGDVMLDVTVTGEAARASPEAPVLVFQEGEERVQPGGAANVAANLAGLGLAVRLAGITGADGDAARLLEALSLHAVEWAGIADPARPTTRKTRFVANGQQVLRLDRESLAPLSDDSAAALLTASDGDTFGCVLVSDYGKGVVTPALLAATHAIAAASGAPLLVDPKGADWARYGEADVIKPNAGELALFTGLPCDDDARIEAALAAAFARCGARALVVTRAARGVSVAMRGGGAVHLPAQAVEVADVCGAGDTSLAALGAALAGGLGLVEAARVSQVAASIAVRRLGNAVVTAHDLLTEARTVAPEGSAAKIADVGPLAARVERWRTLGLRVGFTNGCFDLLHAGHVHSLERARERCDRLVVGLNSDASVARLKGPSRPVLACADRARVLAAIGAVDAVCVFTEDTPMALIEALRPDVLIKGGDYAPDQVVGADLVSRWGGLVEIVPLLEGLSTSRIVHTIQEQGPSRSARGESE